MKAAILIVLSQIYASDTIVTMQEFSSMDSCQAALHLVESVRRGTPQVTCIYK